MKQLKPSGSEYMNKIVDYLKKNIRKGYTLDSLRWALIKQGYSRTAVEKAIEEVNKELAREAPILKKPETQIIEEPVEPSKKPWWKRLFGLD